MKQQESRIRNWNITINPDSECYNDFKDIMRELEPKTKQYAYILHDKDIYPNGEPKLPHYHLVLELENGKTFSAIQKIFKGAHIEPNRQLKSAYQYLIHKNDKEKAQYNTTDIVSNNIEHIKNILEEQYSFEPFNQEMCLEYIIDGTTNYYLFYKRFGLDVCKKYWKPYNDLLTQESLNNSDMLEDMHEIRIKRTEKELKESGLPFEIEETGELVNE